MVEYKRLLVSGAAGFIGSWLCQDLLKRGHFVIGVDDLSGGFYENVAPFLQEYPHQFLFYQTDVGNRNAMTEIFLSHRPQIVVHCASNARESASFFSPCDIIYRNAMIGATLLELGILHKMQRFVFTSSISVYGNGKPPFDERMKRAPVDPYGVSKMATEMMIEQLAKVHGFSYIIIRPHNVFGCQQSLVDPFRNVIAIQMNRLMRKEPLYIYGDGTHTRAFSYIEDSLPCFIRATLNETLTNEIINLGGKEEITINDMVRAVIDEMIGPGAEYPIIYTEPRHGEVPHAFSTWQKSVDLLGYEENIGWKSGVVRMATFAKHKGPQSWRFSPLAIPTDAIPEPWKILHNFKVDK